MYRILRYALSLFITLLSVGYSAQTIQGRGVHAVAGEPLYAAIVAFPSQGIGCATDQDGRFSMKPKTLPDSI
ncbi:MAG: hypothetical protein ACKO66_09575, partial [Flavobacteriales bacterium]